MFRLLAYCLLLIADCQLLIAYCLLLTADRLTLSAFILGRGYLHGFLILHLTHLRSAIDEQHPVKVVDLVLEDARQPARGFHAQRLAVQVVTPEGDRPKAFNLTEIAGDGEATFIGADSLRRMADDFGVGHDEQLRWYRGGFGVVVEVSVFDEDQPVAVAELGRGQPDTGRGSHRLQHVVGESLDLAVEDLDLASPGPQYGIGQSHDLTDTHDLAYPPAVHPVEARRPGRC